MRNGDEWDVVQHTQLCVFDKAGIRKKTKRRMKKRWRKELKMSNKQIPQKPEVTKKPDSIPVSNQSFNDKEKQTVKKRKNQ